MIKSKVPATIEVITGPMFSGKTEGLIRKVLQSVALGEIVQVFFCDLNNIHSSTNNARLQSHGGMSLEAIPIKAPSEIFIHLKKETKIVAIDEIQFFDMSLSRVCDILVRQGRQVIVAGLDKNFRGGFFETVEGISTKVKINRLRAYCTICNMPADYTQRIINGAPAPFDSPLIMVGGSELYEPRCQEHFIISQQIDDKPRDMTAFTSDDLAGSIDATHQLNHWIDRLQAIAGTGLAYAINDVNPERAYDRERYENLLKLAAEMKTFVHNHQIHLENDFTNLLYNDWRIQIKQGEVGHITPKVGAFGALFDEEGKILLLRRNDSPHWDLPGGWCDIGYSAAENVVKEIFEETGFWTTPSHIIGVYDSLRWGFLSKTQMYAFVFYCKVTGGKLRPDPVEAAGIDYFAENRLPSLLPGVSISIQHSFAVYQKTQKEIYFDIRKPWTTEDI